MIITDEHAESDLAKTLDALRQQHGLWRCIHFRLHDAPAAQSAPELRHQLMAAVLRRLPAETLHAYICGDGDVFILAPMLTDMLAAELLAEAGDVLTQHGLHRGHAALYELHLHTDLLLFMLDEKYERRLEGQKYTASTDHLVN